MKILFIEDNPEFSGVLVRLLEHRGYNVTLVDTADEAVRMLDHLQKFKVVILDLMLMRGSVIQRGEAAETGIAIYKRLRKINREIPLIVLTAMTKDEIWDDFKSDAHLIYHHKPPNTSQLFEQIESGL